MGIALRKTPVSGASMAYLWPQRLVHRRRRARMLRRLLFAVGMVVGIVVVAGLVWGVIQTLNEE
jgi:hypothetical protein